MRAINDLTGKSFGRLTVISQTDKRSGGSVVWNCLCLCGNVIDVSGGHLKSGHTVSCGCHKKEISSRNCLDLFTKHGHAKDGAVSKTYSVWLHMLDRCNNPLNAAYSNYGGRGITVCDRWKSYENFLCDMGQSPAHKTLDRIDNNGNYDPNNCRWATMKVQQNNKRNNHIVDYMGEQITLTQLSEKGGVKRSTLYYRINQGYTVEEAVSK